MGWSWSISVAWQVMETVSLGSKILKEAWDRRDWRGVEEARCQEVSL